ncbi:MAG: 50S ribosomal protein L9 [Anaerolineaceae bacterium]
MKVLLIKDVYKLGRAGDVKKVADGYGRNFLIPQSLAVLATPGAMKQIDHIRAQATTKRTALNSELGGLADQLKGVVVSFGVKAGETGKLYGSVTTQMIADAINEKAGSNIDRRNIEVQPIRTLGEYKAHVRLTIDLIPEILVIVHREGEIPTLPETQAPASTKTTPEPVAEAEPAAAPKLAAAPEPEAPAETPEASEAEAAA